jgi:type II secretory pathway pseudopilin PulG
MAALLVALAVMAVLMSVALPAWRHLARREKEAELVFRGEQYARAIALYRTKNGNNFPPSIDVLVQGRYLRKKYKDPMTADGEFRAVPVGNPQGQPGGGAQQPGGGATPPAGRGNMPAPQGPSTPQGARGQPGGFVGGGIMGVASKSTETSIRIYKNQTRYDLWPFTFNMVNRPGGNMPGAQNPGQQGPGAQRPGQQGPGRGGPGREGGPGRGGPGRGGPGRGIGPFIGPDGTPMRPLQIPGGRGRGQF